MQEENDEVEIGKGDVGLFDFVDFEAILPFQIIALLLWPLGLIQTWNAVALSGLCIVLLAQPMILTRTFDNPKKDRWRCFRRTELYCLRTIFIILITQHIT